MIELRSGNYTNFHLWKSWKSAPDELEPDHIMWSFVDPTINENIVLKHMKSYGVYNVTEEKFRRVNGRFSMFVQVKEYLGNEEYENIHRDYFSNKSSPYDPVYVSKKLGITLSEAEIHVAEYKKNKSISRDGFISRHGDKVGLEKFEKFKKTSDSKSLEFYVKKYGKDLGNKIFNEMRFRGSKRCIQYWTHRGYSNSEAAKKVSEHQLNNSGVFKEYWISGGLSKEEAERVIKEINETGEGFLQYSYREFMKRYGMDLLTVALIFKILKVGISSVSCSPEFRKGYNRAKNKLGFLFDNLEEALSIANLMLLTAEQYRLYCALVNAYTHKNNLNDIDNYDKIKKNSVSPDAYTIDHRYSKKWGLLTKSPGDNRFNT
jgi:hypothetical protein